LENEGSGDHSLYDHKASLVGAVVEDQSQLRREELIAVKLVRDTSGASFAKPARAIEVTPALELFAD